MAYDPYPSLPNCPRCQTGKMIPVSERRGFSGGKALVGALIAGPVGLAAGMIGKTKYLFQCTKCGYTKEY